MNVSAIRTTNVTTNETTCDIIDEYVTTVRESVHDNVRESGVLVALAILALSFIFLLFGARLFRWTAAITAGFSSAYAVYLVGRSSHIDAPCDILVGTSLSIGVVFVFLTACLVKLAVFFLGAAAIGFVVHSVFEQFPDLHDVGDQPKLGSLSLSYWILMSSSVLVGGITSRCYTTSVLEVLTASLGAIGMAFSMSVLSTAVSIEINRGVYVATAILTAAVGVFLQRRWRFRRERPVSVETTSSTAVAQT